MNREALALFLECFPESGKEAEMILKYAEEYGQLHILKQDGIAVNMLCTAYLKDIGAEYIFAAGTKPECRKKGFFRRHLEETVGKRPAVLIPETESLFPMYERLGFSPIYAFEADINGDGSGKEFDGTPEELYEIYNSSAQFPKKDFPLFRATLNTHICCGGKIRTKNGVAILTYNGNAVDIFAPDGKSAVEAAKSADIGQYKAIFPIDFEEELKKQGINYRKKSIAMGKNLENAKIYLNTLFN